MKKNIIRFAKIIKIHYEKSEISTTSVVIAFYMLLSIFPLLIIVGNLLPYLQVNPQQVIETIEVVLPKYLEPLLKPVIESLLTNSNGGLISVGAFGLLWTASKGVNFLQQGLNRAYGVANKKTIIARRVVSFIITFVILISSLIFVVVFSFGNVFLEWISPIADWAQPVKNTLLSIKWPAVLVFLFFTLSLLYRIMPDAKIKLLEVFPGAALGAIAFLFSSEIFALFARFTTRKYASYGTFGMVFVLTFWMKFAAGIIIFGAILNAAIQEYRFGSVKPLESGIDVYIEKKTENIFGFFKKRINCDKKEKKKTNEKRHEENEDTNKR